MNAETWGKAFELFRGVTESDREAVELVKLFNNAIKEEVRRSIAAINGQTLSTKEHVSEVRDRREKC